MPIKDPQGLYSALVQRIWKFHADARVRRAEIDVSGGIDSAVMAGLLVGALGPQNVTAIHIGINSSPAALSRAQEVADRFGLKLLVLDATPMFNALIDDLKAEIREKHPDHDVDAEIAKDPTVLGSIRSTLRAPIGRAANRLMGNGIRHGTGNEDEDRFIRFYQKGGDGEVDTNPISMLSKGEVFQLARHMRVPTSILKARPSPDLWGVGDSHSDEDEIGKFLGVTLPAGQTWYSYIDDEGNYTHVGWLEKVARTGPFPPRMDDLTQKVYRAVLHAEQRTRHKLNPNCPDLGGRQPLVDQGVLTDALPQLF